MVGQIWQSVCQHWKGARPERTKWSSLSSYVFKCSPCDCMCEAHSTSKLHAEIHICKQTYFMTNKCLQSSKNCLHVFLDSAPSQDGLKVYILINEVQDLKRIIIIQQTLYHWIKEIYLIDREDKYFFILIPEVAECLFGPWCVCSYVVLRFWFHCFTFIPGEHFHH